MNPRFKTHGIRSHIPWENYWWDYGSDIVGENCLIACWTRGKIGWCAQKIPCHWKSFQWTHWGKTVLDQMIDESLMSSCTQSGMEDVTPSSWTTWAFPKTISSTCLQTPSKIKSSWPLCTVDIRNWNWYRTFGESIPILCRLEKVTRYDKNLRISTYQCNIFVREN